MSIVKQLNAQLPKSIEKEQEIELSKWKEKVSAAGEDTINEVGQLMRQLVSVIETKTELTDDQISKFNKDAVILVADLNKLADRYESFNKFIRDMSLVYVVSLFESYLQRVMDITFRKIPISIGPEKEITLRDLLTCSDIETAKNILIDREVNSFMRKDIEDVAEYILGKFNITIYDAPRWKEFKERFYRRHMIIHNNAKVDENYRIKTENPNATGYLTVTQQYLTETIDLFSQIGNLVRQRFTAKLSQQ